MNLLGVARPFAASGKSLRRLMRRSCFFSFGFLRLSFQFCWLVQELHQLRQLTEVADAQQKEAHDKAERCGTMRNECRSRRNGTMQNHSRDRSSEAVELHQQLQAAEAAIDAKAEQEKAGQRAVPVLSSRGASPIFRCSVRRSA